MDLLLFQETKTSANIETVIFSVWRSRKRGWEWVPLGGWNIYGSIYGPKEEADRIVFWDSLSFNMVEFLMKKWE